MAVCYIMKINTNLKKLALHRIQSGRAVRAHRTGLHTETAGLLPSSHGESLPLPRGCDCGVHGVISAEQSMTLSTIF